MMPTFSLEAARLMVFLIPGFVILWTGDLFTVGKTRSLVEKTISALIFTFFNWVFFWTLVGSFPSLGLLGVNVQPPPSGLASQLWLEFQGQGGFGLLITSLLLGLVLGVIQSKEWDYRLLRWLGLTYRAGHTDVWLQTFTDIRGKWLVVHLEDGSRYMGWAWYYSDQPAVHELFLADASRIEDDGSMTNVDGPGILLTSKSGIGHVEFLNPGQEGSNEQQTGDVEEA